MGYQVFLSYSHKDADMMRRICADLRDAGLTVWVDDALALGTASWKNSIERAIEDTATIVALLSPDAKQSEWITKELDYAHTYGIPIIPVLIRGTEREAVPFDLISAQRLDLRADYEDGLRQLLAAIQHRIPVVEPAPSSHLAGSTMPATPHAAPAQDTLDARNLLDQLRLMWWLFLSPGQLLEYRTRIGSRSIESVAAWLVSTLAWLVMAVPILAYSVGTIRQTGAPQSGLTLLVIWVLILAGWLIDGWLSANPHARTTAPITLVLTAAIIIVIGFLMGKVIGIEVAVNSIERTVFTLALGIPLGIGFALSTNAIGIGAGVALGFVLYVALAGRPLGPDAGAAGVGLIGMTLLVALVLRQSLTSGRLSFLNYLVVAAGAVTYAVMIWIYFLGGWSVLAR